MSQICPSSSHQLVAAAIAFRRARRKFPRNYGIGTDSSSGSFNTENVAKKESNVKLSCSSAWCTCDLMSNHVCSAKSWSGEFPENTSMQNDSSRKPKICSSCRKRDKVINVNNRMNFQKEGDDCSSGDTIVTSTGTKCTKYTSNKLLDRHSHCQKRDCKNLSSKVDSLDLLYDGFCKGSEHVMHKSSLYSPNDCRGCEQLRNIKKGSSWILRQNSNNSRSFVSPSSSCSCNFHSAKHTNSDLHQLAQNNIYHHTRHYYHSQDCCHRRHVHNSPSVKEDRCLDLKTHVQPVQNSPWQKCCHNETFTKDKSFLGRSKNFEKMFLPQEEKDEEHDDSVAVINHKDSLSILAEKYKANKRSRHKLPNEDEPVKEVTKRSSNVSSSPAVSDKESIDEKSTNVKDNERSAARQVCTHSEYTKSHSHDCGQIFRESDNSRLKNLTSRLIKTGICCSAKGTPWRHTF